MVVGYEPLVPKCHPCREWSPCKECRECRYMGVVGSHTGKHTGKCRDCNYMVMECRYMDVPTFTMSHCMGSIPCMGGLFALRALSPPPHIPTFTAWILIHSIGLHHQDSLHFPVWAPFSLCR